MIITAVTQNHGNCRKSRHKAKITVITAIVNSWFTYIPSYHLFPSGARSLPLTSLNPLLLATFFYDVNDPVTSHTCFQRCLKTRHFNCFSPDSLWWLRGHYCHPEALYLPCVFTYLISISKVKRRFFSYRAISSAHSNISNWMRCAVTRLLYRYFIKLPLYQTDAGIITGGRESRPVLTTTSQFNGNCQISTLHRNQTPQPITIKLCAVDYDQETNT